MNQKNKTVFVVDDDQDLVELMSYNLEKEGYKIKKAFSGLQSLWTLELEERPDCILLDLMMPSPDGYELCDYLKSSEDYRDIPLVIVSAKNSSEDMEKAFRLGADAYLAKPFSIENLKTVVSRLASKRIGNIRGTDLPKPSH